MRPQGTALQLEKRRRQAIRLLKAVKNLSVVARALSASVSSVYRWYRQYKRRDAKGLKPRPAPGRPPRLSKSHKTNLGKVLLKGPLTAGYRTDLWTLQRVAEVNRRAPRRSISSQPCLEAAERLGVELPNTGAPGIAARRGSNRPVETLSVVPYKKTTNGWALIWYSSMNPAFCSSPTSPGHGHPRVIPLCSIISISSTGSRPLVLWLCPRKEGVWPSTSPFVPAILPAWTLADFSGTSSTICGNLSFCCGTVEPSKCAKKSHSTSRTIPDSRWSFSPPVHQSSIRLSTYGIRPIVASSMLHRKTLQSFTECSTIQRGGYADPKSFSGRVSMLPISVTRVRLSIAYAKLNS